MDRKLGLLPNKQLLDSTSALVRQEREVITKVLSHLREIDSRRLHLEIGYPSLFAFCVKELKYSEAAAMRRINAMRALKEIPELGKKIESGELTLTNVAKAQSVLRHQAKINQPINSEQKIELFRQLEQKSSLEAEKFLCQKFPLTIPQERVRVITKDKTEIKFVASSELMEKLTYIKSLFSHKNPNPNYEELFQLMANVVIGQKTFPQKILKAQRKAPALRSRTKSLQKNSRTQSKVIPTGSQLESLPAGRRGHKFSSRYIPAVLKQEIWHRDRACCQFKHLVSDRICGSRHQLQLDHLKPLALGGKTEIDNLQLVCAEHNRLRAIKIFGRAKMTKYLRS